MCDERIYALVSGDGKWITSDRVAGCPAFVPMEDDVGYRMTDAEAEEMLSEMPNYAKSEGITKKVVPVNRKKGNEYVKKGKVKTNEAA